MPAQDTRRALSDGLGPDRRGCFRRPRIPDPCRRCRQPQFPGTARFEVRRGSAQAVSVLLRSYDRDQPAIGRGGSPAAGRFPPSWYRFKREFRARGRYSNPNLIQLYELFCEDHSGFLQWSSFADSTFSEYVERERTGDTTSRTPCDVDLLRDALWHCRRAFLELHRRGILHRDIKPANVLVSLTGVPAAGFRPRARNRVERSTSAILAGTAGLHGPRAVRRQQPAGTSLRLVQPRRDGVSSPHWRATVQRHFVSVTVFHPAVLAQVAEIPDGFSGSCARIAESGSDQATHRR